MSTTQEAAGLQLPAEDQARSVIFDRVYADAFFSKLASLGHVPRTRAEAQAMLEMGASLGALANDPGAVKAADEQSFYIQSKQALDKLLHVQGWDGAQQQAGHNDRANRTKAAAYALAQDPDIYLSALSLVAAAEAEQQAAA